MNLVIPIIFFALAMGLVFKRMGPREWLILGLWIAVIILRYWINGPSASTNSAS